MKKFMIRCDMEGASGIVSYEQAEPGRPGYETGQRYFMSDLNAAVSGLKDGGADEVHIYDEHCGGTNVSLDGLTARGGVFVYAGKPPYTADRPGGLDETFAGLVLLGFHAKRGSEGCLLAHTYEPDIRDIRIDGASVGEIGTESRLAADLGVPLVLVTGDSAGVEEARAFGAPTCRYVSVKRSLSETSAVCYPAADTAKAIYEAAFLTAALPEEPRKLPPAANARLEVRFFDTPFARAYRAAYGDLPLEGRPFAALWAEYQARKAAILAKIGAREETAI